MAYAPFDLTGKVALVTGGNGGIGLGMADALAQAGADVVIWGNNPTKNAAAEAQLAAHGRRVAVAAVDVTDRRWWMLASPRWSPAWVGWTSSRPMRGRG